MMKGGWGGGRYYGSVMTMMTMVMMVAMTLMVQFQMGVGLLLVHKESSVTESDAGGLDPDARSQITLFHFLHPD